MSKLPVVGAVAHFARRLRFPRLFLLTGTAFVLDLFFPDLIPFADEILLGLGTAVLSQIRRRKELPAADAGGTAPPAAPPDSRG